MDIKKEIVIAKELFHKENYLPEMLVEYLANKKIYHKVAIVVFSIATGIDRELSGEFIYDNDYYYNFKNEKNPFNDELLGDNNGVPDDT